jgi:hypothetical protein
MVHDGHMTTKRIVSKQEAKDLLIQTVRANGSGRLGTPHGSTRGYSLDEAQAVIERAASCWTDKWVSDFDVLYADTEHGQHVWYVRPNAALYSPTTNPWEA